MTTQIEIIHNVNVRGSVHHSTIHKEKSNKMQQCIKIVYYSVSIRGSTCFGRHTAHHQKPKTVLAASGFSYMRGYWTCRWWTLSGTVCLTTSTICTSNNPSPLYEAQHVSGDTPPIIRSLKLHWQPLAFHT